MVLIYHAGQSYVVFGNENSWPEIINLADLNGNDGFVINGLSWYSGFSVSGVGDVNGDNIADILIGGPEAQDGILTGQSYVIFGSRGPWSRLIKLADLNGVNGFYIHRGASQNSGYSVSRAGDVNGDGIDDILISAEDLATWKAVTFVIFGNKNPWSKDFDPQKLDGTNGFVIYGIVGAIPNFHMVSGAGDINGDEIDDILVSDPHANNVYAIFGSKQRWPAAFHAEELNGENGFIIHCIYPKDGIGTSLSEAGDVNGDGIGDILIGAAQEANGGAGQSYVIFGRKGSWPKDLYLVDLNGSNGFSINGHTGDYSETVVSNAGDVNKDGITDILIGAPQFRNNVGLSYIIFGKKGSWPVVINRSDLDGDNGFIINGINAGDYSGTSVSGVGDINGDGISDILIGANGARNTAGQSYVIFGNKTKFSKN